MQSLQQQNLVNRPSCFLAYSFTLPLRFINAILACILKDKETADTVALTQNKFVAKEIMFMGS